MSAYTKYVASFDCSVLFRVEITIPSIYPSIDAII